MTFGQICMQRMCDEKKLLGQLSTESGAAIIDLLDKERRKKKPGAPKEPRPRNPLFDALALRTGTTDLSQITKDGAKMIGGALGDIRKVTPKLTVEEINRRAGAYVRKYPTWQLTAKSLAKYWAEFSPKKEAALANDPYREPTFDWRAVASRRFPDANNWVNPHDFTSVKWFDISLTLRQEILRAVS